MLDRPSATADENAEHDPARRPAGHPVTAPAADPTAEPAGSTEGPPVDTCPVCQSSRFTYQFTRERLPIVQCDACGLLMRDPQPSDARLTTAASSRTESPLTTVTAAAYLDRIERYAGWSATDRCGRRLLDLRVGQGDLLLAAQQRGYEIAGLDTSPSAVARANDRLGEPAVRVANVGSAGFTDGQFDVCVLSDTIERVRNPARVLQDVWRVLRPGGYVFMATPNFDRWSAGLLREPSRAFTLERLFFFDGRTLESVLARNGFEHIRLSAGLRTHDAIDVGASGIEALARRSDAPPIDWRRGRLSVVLPVFNEKHTFSEVIGQLLAKDLRDLDMEIIIVESQSTDGTRDDVRAVAGHPRVRVIWEDRPRGKGHAVRAGLAAATGDFVLIQDADLEYDLADYDMLLEPLRSFQCAFVLGARHGRDGHTWKVRHFTDRVLLGQWMNFGHLLFTTLFNVVYGQRLSDPFTMFKVFRRECLSGLALECNAFDFDWELAGKLVRCGYRPIEIPVNYTSRSFSEGKKVTLVRDPLTWLRACFKYRLSPLKAEGPPQPPAVPVD
jgi:2-polyprenyl-3-methyl-5-hydroxy-6-metoxy-1,4-benzoquinol methylase